jgi:protein AFG1
MQMRRPPAKLCADCVPCAVRRSHVARVAPLPRSIVQANSRGMRPMTYSTLTKLPTRNSSQSSVPPKSITVPVNATLQKRGLATAAEGVAQAEALSETQPPGAPLDGPMREYDIRVEEGRLRDDPYQRGKRGNKTVQALLATRD